MPKRSLRWYLVPAVVGALFLVGFMTACQGPQGQVGPAGAPGLQGPPGPEGKPLQPPVPAKPTVDQINSQWKESGHANIDLAVLEATVENRGATAAHCGRCHSGQGFLAWLKQGDLTKQIQGAKGNATVDELKALGLTVDKVQPQNCATCHDTASAAIKGDTAMLPAGFKAVGVGRGALCITCHNTRNGARNDSTGTPASYSAPHTAAQGDVLMGENAYFVSVGARSPHSFIGDSCVTCHVELTLPPAEGGQQLGGPNHTFEASLEICSSCHGVFTGGSLQESTEAKLHELGEKMAGYLLSKLGDQFQLNDYTPHQYQGKEYDVKSANVTVTKSDIASIEPTEPHGQQGFLIKFKSPVTFTYSPAGEAAHSVSMSKAEVQLADITTDGTNKVIALGDPLVKVGWNYFLIHGDGSEGVHNPNFIWSVLDASINALK
ncbi:MAG: collagen-like protein [Chloroflexi bacterium]|nr:collagen-like protein [Chloroflexota bacterium]